MQNDVELVAVTVPAGVKPGQSLHVTGPSGVTVQVVVPAGHDPGSTFHASIQTPVAVATAVVEPVPVVAANTATAVTPKATTLGATLNEPLNFQPTTPLKRSCGHICSYIMAALMVLCGIISLGLLIVSENLEYGKYVGYVSVHSYYHARRV